MPADVDDVYTYPGGSLWNSYGNERTCDAQGFFVISGLAFTMYGTCALNIYYVCTIRYGISNETLNRRILPIMFVVSCLLVLPVTVTTLSFDLINPRPYELYCTVGPYPRECNTDEHIQCIRGHMDPKAQDTLLLVITVLIVVGFFFVLVPLSLVFMSVYRSESRNRANGKAEEEARKAADSQDMGERDGYDNEIYDQPMANSDSTENADFQHTRTVGRVAIMYIAAFLATWCMPIISLMPIEAIKNLQKEDWNIINDTRGFFLPLQGFLNALIFIYNKAHLLRKSSSEELSFFRACMRVIISPSRIPQDIALTSLRVVNEDLGCPDEMLSKAWIDFDHSKKTPSLDLRGALSQTGMNDEDFERVEKENPGDFEEHKYYTDIQCSSDRPSASLERFGKYRGSKTPLSDADEQQLSIHSASFPGSNSRSEDLSYAAGSRSMFSGFSSMLSFSGGEGEEEGKAEKR